MVPLCHLDMLGCPQVHVIAGFHPHLDVELLSGQLCPAIPFPAFSSSSLPFCLPEAVNNTCP